MQKSLDQLERSLKTRKGQTRYLRSLRYRIDTLYRSLGLAPSFAFSEQTRRRICFRLSRVRIVWSPSSPFSYAAPSPSQSEHYLFSRYGAFARLMDWRNPSTLFSTSDEATLRLATVDDLEHELLHAVSEMYYTPYLGRRGWLMRTLLAPAQMLKDLLIRRRLLSTQTDFEQILGEDPTFALEEGVTALLSARPEIYPTFQTALTMKLRTLPPYPRSRALASILRTWLNESDPREADLVYAFTASALRVCRPAKIIHSKKSSLNRC